MKRKWLKRILIGLSVCLVFSPCAFCLWQTYVFFGSAALFRLSLPLYPGALEIATDFIFNSAESGYQVIYYWTDVPIQVVQEFYVNLISSGTNRMDMLVYAGLDEGGVNRQESCDSYVDAPPSCVEIRLLDFGEREQVSIPDALLVRGRSSSMRTPEFSQPRNLRGGILIIYGYFTPEM